jgi:hypothetical protein
MHNHEREVGKETKLKALHEICQLAKTTEEKPCTIISRVLITLTVNVASTL